MHVNGEHVVLRVILGVGDGGRAVTTADLEDQRRGAAEGRDGVQRPGGQGAREIEPLEPVEGQRGKPAAARRVGAHPPGPPLVEGIGDVEGIFRAAHVLTMAKTVPTGPPQQGTRGIR